MNNERIELNDVSINDVRNVFKKYIEESDVEKVIDFLSTQKRFFDDQNEFFNVDKKVEMQPGILGMIISNTRYFINIKLATIELIASILDCKLNIGLATYFLSGFNKTGPFITVIDEYDGSKCIIKEALYCDKRTLRIESLLCNQKGECVNNDISCKYREEGNCKIKKKDIIEIIDKLVKENVFKKTNDGYKLAL